MQPLSDFFELHYKTKFENSLKSEKDRRFTNNGSLKSFHLNQINYAFPKKIKIQGIIFSANSHEKIILWNVLFGRFKSSFAFMYSWPDITNRHRRKDDHNKQCKVPAKPQLFDTE